MENIGNSNMFSVENKFCKEPERLDKFNMTFFLNTDANSNNTAINDFLQIHTNHSILIR